MSINTDCSFIIFVTFFAGLSSGNAVTDQWELINGGGEFTIGLFCNWRILCIDSLVDQLGLICRSQFSHNGHSYMRSPLINRPTRYVALNPS